MKENINSSKSNEDLTDLFWARGKKTQKNG